jgi:hypothetical protein
MSDVVPPGWAVKCSFCGNVLIDPEDFEGEAVAVSSVPKCGCVASQKGLPDKIRALLKKHRITFEKGRYFGIPYQDVHGDKNRFIEDVAELVQSSTQTTNSLAISGENVNKDE